MNTHLSAGQLRSYVTTERHPEVDILRVTDNSPEGCVRQRQAELCAEFHLDLFQFLDAVRDFDKGAEIDPEYREAVHQFKETPAADHGDQLEYTRIWMGCVPPTEGNPPYAVVMGERFTGEWGRRRRPVVILDEAKSLHQQDYPDMDDFLEAVIALKDLYSAQATTISGEARLSPMRIYTPLKGTSEKVDDMANGRGWFFGRLESAPGLTWYDAKVSDAELEAGFPFFRSRTLTAGVMEPPFADDEAMCAYALSSLAAHDRLTWRPHCLSYDGNEFPGVILAAGYVALALERYPWVEDLNNRTSFGTGYDKVAPRLEDLPGEVKGRLNLRRNHRDALAFQAGVPVEDIVRRRASEQKRRRPLG